jgi:hypothetical protein
VLGHLGRRSINGRKRKLAGLFALLLACVIGVGAYAFTASNTVKPHFAGGGSATVSGYEVKEPTKYTWTQDGKFLTEVVFELNHAAKDVKVAYVETGTPKTADWADCGESVGVVVTCKLKGAPAYAAEGVPNADAVEMSVVANENGEAAVE